MIVWDADDFGCDHIISDMCQSHDCRDVLLKFKEANPKFKATLFAIPGEMTAELSSWCQMNKDWIEIAVHGFFHKSNYECENLTYEDMEFLMGQFKDIIDTCFVKGFKAPGWQISDGCYKWLVGNGWWVADQAYNDKRRPVKLPAYVNDNGAFSTYKGNDGDYHYSQPVNGLHYHTWNCVGNGVYELYDQIMKDIKDEKDFKFVSEVL